jgi:hypothetical protein
MVMGRGSGRGKVLCSSVKYWLRILQMAKELLERERYEWQINNSKSESWANKLKE